MDTPIYNFVTEYVESKNSRLHMPGHKGKKILGCEQLDITEIKDADSLFHADGIISESENNATQLFGTGGTFYSTEGSTHCIKSMVALGQRWAKNITKDVKSINPGKVLALRNVHKSFINACAILDLNVQWIYPDLDNNSICECKVSIDTIKKMVEDSDAFALYITTPDYLGNLLDVQAVAKLCHDNNKILLVDNAHGAYLKFLNPSKHPIELGADICSDSAHKTLPVLTGGAYLHISSKHMDLVKCAKDIMSLFGSTSPSYLTLCSLDLCNLYLDKNAADELQRVSFMVNDLKRFIEDNGFEILGDESIKLTIYCISNGISGEEFADRLREYKVECEYADNNLVVLMFSASNSDEDYVRIKKCVKDLADTVGDLPANASPAKALNANTSPDKAINANASPAKAIIVNNSTNNYPKAVMSIREAVFSQQEKKKVDECFGKVCGMSVVSCPPAIPVVVSGELIDENVIQNLKDNGIEQVYIVN